MYPLLVLLITAAAAVGGFSLARRFVRRRLRFVDAVYSPFAPVVAGLIAATVVWPAALLPIVSTGTAIWFGVGAGVGTASGVRALRRNSGG